mmetsp:Transcript_15464/g.33510  ORF Transcript_15464/g.33510 Transcript_15464/m.33510 type:complete len:208 (-) Transcript_15464:318-941(-)
MVRLQLWLCSICKQRCGDSWLEFTSFRGRCHDVLDYHRLVREGQTRPSWKVRRMHRGTCDRDSRCRFHPALGCPHRRPRRGTKLLRLRSAIEKTWLRRCVGRLGRAWHGGRPRDHPFRGPRGRGRVRRCGHGPRVVREPGNCRQKSQTVRHSGHGCRALCLPLLRHVLPALKIDWPRLHPYLHSGGAARHRHIRTWRSRLLPRDGRD